MIEFRMLGSIDLHDGRGRPIMAVLNQPKRLALLAYLACHPSRFCSRDTLLGLFWPELDATHARASLRQTLYYVRRTLGHGALPSHAAGVEVNREEVWSDAREFISALSSGMAERALSLYRGDLLPGFFLSDAPGFEQWMEEERARLRRLASQAAWMISDRAMRDGNEAAAAAWGRHALGITPTDEASARRLMDRLDNLGNPSAAIEVYEELTRRLSADYDLAPAPESRAIADRIRTRREVVGGMTAPAHLIKGMFNRAEAGDQRLAVLPFEVDGLGTIGTALTQALTSGLSKMHGLLMVSPGSSASAAAQGRDAFAAAGRLHVRYVLAGSVTGSGPEVEVTARLLDAQTQSMIWMERHSGSATLLPEIRDALIARVTRTLRLPAIVTIGQSTRSPDDEWRLLDANGMARHELGQWSPEAFDRAIMIANEALGRSGDDEYVLASMGQGHLPHVILGTRADERHLSMAERTAARMMACNPESGPAHVLRGLVRLRRGNARGCADDLRRSLQLDPNSPDALFWLSLVYIISGRALQAKPIADRLLTVDPMNSTSRCLPGYIEAHSGHFADAHPHYEAMCRMEPNSAVNRWCYSQLLVRAGRTAEAVTMMEDVIAVAPRTTIARQARVFSSALSGDRRGTRQGLTKTLRTEAQTDEHGSWWLASALSIGGQTDEALYWLNNAVRLGYVDEPFLARIDPCLEGLRGTRGFQRIMARARKAYENFDAPSQV